MIRISQCEIVVNEENFLSTNRIRAQGKPGTPETENAKERLKAYEKAKNRIPLEIIESLTKTLRK